MFRKLYLSVIGLLLFMVLLFFVGCPMGDGGGGSNDDSNNATFKEEVKWTKVLQLSRPNFGDRNKFDESSYNIGWGASDGYFWKLESGKWNKKESYGSSQIDALLTLDENTGWAVGKGSVWKLENGVWTDESSTYGGLFGESGYRIALVDINTGWAVGENGSAVKLSGGAWSSENSGISGNFTAIDLIDGDNGWGAVSDNKFYKLDTGNWVDLGDAFTGNIYKIVLDDIDTGFAYGDKVWELASGSWSDAGVVPPGTDSNSKTTYLSVKETVNGYSGWALYDPDIYQDGNEKLESFTYDGQSTTWVETNMPSGTIPIQIIDDGTYVWAVCENGAVWKYENSTWSINLTGGGKTFWPNYGVGADFIDINNGRVVGYADQYGMGTNLKLENGAWNYDSSISHAGYFLGIALVNDIDTGWITAQKLNASDDDKAFAKLNAGEWSLNGEVQLTYNDKIRAVALIDANNGWAVGSVYDSGSGKTYDTFWKLDSGTWTQSEQFSTNNKPSFIHLDDINNGWATAKDGTKWALQSGSWGLSTDRQGRAEASGLDDEDVMFYPLDENNGWETYYDDQVYILKLVNNVWQNVQQGIDIIGSPVTAWAFSDMDNGWIAVGKNIYKVKGGSISKYGTDEDGNYVISNYLEDEIYKIWLQDYKNGWAIGENMSIYRLSPNE